MTALLKGPRADSATDPVLKKNKRKLSFITPAWKKSGNGVSMVHPVHITGDKVKFESNGFRTVQHAFAMYSADSKTDLSERRIPAGGLSFWVSSNLVW